MFQKFDCILPIVDSIKYWVTPTNIELVESRSVYIPQNYWIAVIV